MKSNKLISVIKEEITKMMLNEEVEQKQMLNESCTCYTQNPVSGGPALVYYTCAGQSGNATVAASCSCCCNAWLHPQDVADDPCLTDSVAPPTGGGPTGPLSADDRFVEPTRGISTGGGRPKGIDRGIAIREASRKILKKLK